MKNAFDLLASVGYSGTGAIRAIEHSRQIVANFSMFDIRNQVGINIFGTDLEEEKAANADALNRAHRPGAGEIERMVTPRHALR